MSWTLLAAVLLILAGVGAAYAVSRRPASATPLRDRPQRNRPRRRTGPAAGAPAPTAPTTDPGAHPATVSQTPAAAPQPAGVATPGIVGRSLPGALALVRRAGLVAVVSHVSSSQPAGRVIAQRPAAGAKMARGGKVQLEVSVQPPVVVPNVVGMSGVTANHTLTADHLVASLRYVPSTRPARTVVAQFPRPGRKAHRGSRVLINISNGARPSSTTAATAPGSSTDSAVPDVVGEDESTAANDLEAAGFSVQTVDTPTTDPGEDGVVLDQSPTGGSKASASSSVTIDVGRYSDG